MRIENRPHRYTEDSVITSQRQGTAGRGEYLYYIAEAAKRRGIPLDFLYEAVYCWGKECLGREWDRVPEPEELTDLFTETANKVWENEITVSGDEIRVRMHHCPFLTAWMSLTDDPACWKELCAIAMEADRALFAIPGYTYELRETVFDGCESCLMAARKKQVNDNV